MQLKNKRSLVALGCGVLMLVQILLAGGSLRAQTADQAWLRFPRKQSRPPLPTRVETTGRGVVSQAAAQELQNDLEALYGADAVQSLSDARGKIVLGTVDEINRKYPGLLASATVGADAYVLRRAQYQGADLLAIAGGSERGEIYGAFALLRRLTTGTDVAHLDERDEPAYPIRWVDEWDNFDGSIERGYAGRSIFFDAGRVRNEMGPMREYARLLASVGINAVNLNNVNNAGPALEDGMIAELARVADTMRPWGIRIAISVDIASPQKVGGLSTFDPLDAGVQKFWTEKIDAIYKAIPDFAGLTVKADSEGQPGPASYGRTPVEAANMLAEALRPHGGVVLYRAFVYDHHLDWRNRRADRARAAWDIFHPLDGKFADNVIVQTKEGPIDFQAREPVSPLFAGLEHTASAVELQITQEYTGQQRHMVYLAPMWKWVLDFDLLKSTSTCTRVRDVLAGSGRRPGAGGMVGVANVGQDHWLSSPMALANLYAFGRLAWNPALDAGDLGREWSRQTFATGKEGAFGRQQEDVVVDMLQRSWPAYENYTGPLGLQTLTDVTGSHYGPNIESSERNGWGQWHDADAGGVGKDRSVATGSGFAGQYPPALAALYESAQTTPDNLVLFFHHLAYTQRLHSGKTVIQSIYDSHYEGAAEAASFVAEWEQLEGHVEPVLWREILGRLQYQAGHAIVWRDAVTQYFAKLSGIADEKGRVGHFAGRMEAEDASLTGYRIVEVRPWEDASRGKAVQCDAPTAAEGGCLAMWRFSGADGKYDLVVQYFDLHDGVAKFTADVNGDTVYQWHANQWYPGRALHGDNSTRVTIHGVKLKTGDQIRIQGIPDGSDHAALDYIEITPATAQQN